MINSARHRTKLDEDKQKAFIARRLERRTLQSEILVMTDRMADVGVLIVGFRNADDLVACLTALSDAALEPAFDVFICENGGMDSYQRALRALLSPQGPCRQADEPAASEFGSVHRRQTPTFPKQTLKCVGRMRDRQPWVCRWHQCLASSFAVSHRLERNLGLNPDTEPEASALAALVERAETGRKGMVGSTILDIERQNEVRCRGGLHWQKLAARTVAIGLGEPLNSSYDLSAVEAAIDSPSGASMYVTRPCLEKIGPMDESYFLFFEDLDWGLRAKACGLGYASASIVRHQRGTTTVLRRA